MNQICTQSFLPIDEVRGRRYIQGNHQKKKSNSLGNVLLPIRKKRVQDFNSFASTGENNSYQLLTRSCVPTTYSIWFFGHIIFNPITFTGQEFFPPTHFIGKETSSEKLIYQGHLACI